MPHSWSLALKFETAVGIESDYISRPGSFVRIAAYPVNNVGPVAHPATIFSVAAIVFT
jgi:hypothetical protein